MPRPKKEKTTRGYCDSKRCEGDGGFNGVKDEDFFDIQVNHYGYACKYFNIKTKKCIRVCSFCYEEHPDINGIRGCSFRFSDSLKEEGLREERGLQMCSSCQKEMLGDGLMHKYDDDVCKECVTKMLVKKGLPLGIMRTDKWTKCSLENLEEEAMKYKK